MPELLPSLRDLRLSRWVRRAQKGDRAAFRSLFRALHPPVYRYVARRLRRREDAEDVVAQVFESLLVALPRIDPRRGTVFAYAISAARRAVIDQLRAPVSSPLEPDAPFVDPAPSALERSIAGEQLEAVHAALAGLPAETRELLSLRFGDDLRFSEIAELLGMSEAAVRQRVSRTVRELREQLAETPAVKEVLP